MSGTKDPEGRMGPICDAMQELLSALIDQELSDDERLEVEDHLGVCRDCVRELDTMRRLHQHLVASIDLPGSESSAPVPHSLMPVHVQPKNGHGAAPFQKDFLKPQVAARQNRRWLALASAAVLIGLLAVVLGRIQEPPRRIANAAGGEADLTATLTRVVAPLGKLATTQDEIRERQDAQARTMAKELRLLRVLVGALPPDDPEANAVRAEIEQLALKLHEVRDLAAAQPSGRNP